MGGRGSGGARSSGSTGGGMPTKEQLMKTAQDFVSHNLNNGYRYSKVTDASIVGKVDENGMANVKMSYEDSVRIVTGYDIETNREEYSYETEYHTNTFRIKVR